MRIGIVLSRRVDYVERLHSLLKRQLKLVSGDVPDKREWQTLIEAVNDAYMEFDADRRMLERSLELSSNELLQANAEMRAIIQALRESEEKYRTLVENVPIGVYRNTIGSRGRFLQANRAMVKIFGYESIDEFMKVHDEEGINFIAKPVAPDVLLRKIREVLDQ